MARKTKDQKAAEAFAKKEAKRRADEIDRLAQEEEDERVAQEKAQDERMGLLREIDALLWQVVDGVGRCLFKLMTLGANDIASYRVRGRIATSITIGYDDGYTYHVTRRLGGLQTRPVILEFEHSDPGHVGTVHAAVQFQTGGGPVVIPEHEEEESE